MPKIQKPHLTIEKQSRICLLSEQGYSTRQIGSIEGVGNKTVARIVAKKKETGSLENKAKSGRPRILQKPDERRILRLITSKECKTAVDIQRKLHSDYNIQISADIVRAVLKRNGFKAYIRAKKPFLKKEHQQKRLKFAQTYKDWTAEDWMRVVWSDESKVSIFGSDGRKYYWKRSNDPICASHIKPTMKFCGGSIMA